METKIDTYGVAVLQKDGKAWIVIYEAFTYLEAGIICDKISMAGTIATSEKIYTTIYYPGQERP